MFQARTVARGLGAFVLAQVLVVLCWTALAGAGVFTPVTLVDGSSTVMIDPASPGGVYSWQVANQSQLSQQWFWFRANLPGWDDREYSVDKIGPPTVAQFVPNMVKLTYTETRFSVELTYMLTGAGEGVTSADLAEVIRITNKTAAPIKFTLFQYSNFDLNGDLDDERVEVLGGNTVDQTDGAGTAISETVATGKPDLSETAVLGITLTKLQDDYVSNLDGSALVVGPADLTWAFEWKDRSIGPGQSLFISKDKVLSIAPVAEPGALGLIGLGLLRFARRRRTE